MKKSRSNSNEKIFDQMGHIRGALNKIIDIEPPQHPNLLKLKQVSYIVHHVEDKFQGGFKPFENSLVI